MQPKRNTNLIIRKFSPSKTFNFFIEIISRVFPHTFVFFNHIDRLAFDISPEVLH